MEIVSHQFTNRLREGKQIIDVPPGTPFEVDEERAHEMIKAGRAEPFTGGEDGPAATGQESNESTEAAGAGERVPDTSPPAGGGESPEAGAADLEKITEAILNLDADNSEHFLGDGRPNVKAINELVAEELGRSVTADERDAAWAALQPDA